MSKGWRERKIVARSGQKQIQWTDQFKLRPTIFIMPLKTTFFYTLERHHLPRENTLCFQRIGAAEAVLKTWGGHV